MKGNVLRVLPGTSPVHRLWAGTKLIAVAVISTALVFAPTWPMLGATCALLVLTAIVGRISPLAVPRPPWWLWALLVFGAAVNLVVGWDAVVVYGQGLLFAVVLLWASISVAWTTPMADIAPAVATLLSPLRKVRAPVDEWAASLGLCLRALPLLIDEIQTLVAARRLRPRGSGRSGRAEDTFLVDAVTAVMSAAIRRSAEMGNAIEARGGSAVMAVSVDQPKPADAVALVLVAVTCVLGLVFGSL